MFINLSYLILFCCAGQPDVDCVGDALCCFDGCANVCVGGGENTTHLWTWVKVLTKIYLVDIFSAAVVISTDLSGVIISPWSVFCCCWSIIHWNLTILDALQICSYIICAFLFFSFFYFLLTSKLALVSYSMRTEQNQHDNYCIH